MMKKSKNIICTFIVIIMCISITNITSSYGMSYEGEIITTDVDKTELKEGEEFKVSASKTSVETNIIPKNILLEGLIETGIDTKYDEYDITIKSEKLYDLLNNPSNLQEIEGYVYDVLLIEIPTNTKKVTIKSEKSTIECNIVEKNRIKYAEYKVKLFKKDITNKYEQFKEVAKNLCYDEMLRKITITSYLEDNQTETNQLNLRFSITEPKVVMQMFSDCELTYGDGSSGYSLLGISTLNSFEGRKLEVECNNYIGEKFNIDNIGTFELEKKEENTTEMGTFQRYIYQYYIKDITMFYKPKTYFFYYENPQEKILQVFELRVEGQERKVYEINQDNGIDIDLECVFTNGGEVKSNTILEEDKRYLDMESQITTLADDLYIQAYDIKVTGDYEGELCLTFNVGEQFNGKKAYIIHYKENDDEFEKFEETVKDGKVKIVVDSLSPFMLAVEKDKTEQSSNNKTEQSSNNKTEQSSNNKTEQSSNNKTEQSLNNNEQSKNVDKPEHKLDNEPKTGYNISKELGIILLVITIAIVVTIKKYNK